MTNPLWQQGDSCAARFPSNNLFEPRDTLVDRDDWTGNGTGQAVRDKVGLMRSPAGCAQLIWEPEICPPCDAEQSHQHYVGDQAGHNCGDQQQCRQAVGDDVELTGRKGKNHHREDSCHNQGRERYRPHDFQQHVVTVADTQFPIGWQSYLLHAPPLWSFG